jgi:broad specificity phosphatase PhoE
VSPITTTKTTPRRAYSWTKPSTNKHANELLQWLKRSGAVKGAHGSIKIRAERLSSFAENNDSQETCTITTGENSKIIHFQRHGQGYHNLIYKVLQDNGVEIEDIYSKDSVTNPFVRPEIVDSPLTELGRAQCAKQRQKLSKAINPELLIISPLHRALQTAQITFQDFRDAVPFVAHEACREELGLLTCNRRRPLSETKREFPSIDFSLLHPMEEDHLWDPNQREDPKSKSQRIYKFLVDFVRHQPQKEIAIVGHSAWLFTMCNSVVDCGDDEDLSSWFGTSEIRSVKMTWEDE